MPLSINLEELPAPAQRLLGPAAPPPMKLMAAGGVVPGLKPGELVTVIAVLSSAEDAAVSEKARATLAKLPPPVLTGALVADLQTPVVELLASHYAGNAEVVEKLLRMPRIGVGALELLASRADERIGELVATNERLLLQHPTVIENLYLNRRVRMSTADRILELAVRNGLELSIPAFKEAAAAIRDELIAEPTPEPTFEDNLAAEVAALAEEIAVDSATEDTHEVDDEGEEKLKEKLLPLHARLLEMSISQRIRMATLGNSAERLLLIRDKNRLVAAAAAQSPRLNENDVARISTSRQVSDEVLRIIAMNKEWTRSYQIKMNLVQNPRTPLVFSSRLIVHLRDSDLVHLTKNKNVPATIQQAARQHLARKQKKN